MHLIARRRIEAAQCASPPMVGLSKALSQRIGTVLSASWDVWQVANRFRRELVGRDQLVVVGVNGIKP